MLFLMSKTGKIWRSDTVHCRWRSGSQSNELTAHLRIWADATTAEHTSWRKRGRGEIAWHSNPLWTRQLCLCCVLCKLSASASIIRGFVQQLAENGNFPPNSLSCPSWMVLSLPSNAKQGKRVRESCKNAKNALHSRQLTYPACFTCSSSWM